MIPRLESLLMTVEFERERANRSVLVSLLRLERDLLGDVAKLRGEFPERRSMSVGEMDEWRIVLDALSDHPRAMLAVSNALSDGAVS